MSHLISHPIHPYILLLSLAQSLARLQKNCCIRPVHRQCIDRKPPKSKQDGSVLFLTLKVFFPEREVDLAACGRLTRFLDLSRCYVGSCDKLVKKI